VFNHTASFVGSGGYVPLAWTVSGSEQMRLNSTGLGIGTSSPGAKLDVAGAGSNVGFKLRSGGNSGVNILDIGDTAGAGQLILDASGNLGIGTSSPSTKFEVVKQGNSSGGTMMLTGSKTNNATKYGYMTGAHYTSDTYPQGIGIIGCTALSGENNISIGGDPGEFLAATTIKFYTAANTTTAGGSERARITSGGDLLVGTTTSGAKLTVEQGSANANGAQITNQTYNYQTLGLHNTATANDNVWVTFGTEASFTTRGSITYNRAGGLTAYNVTSDYRAKDIIGPVNDSGALIDSVPVYMGKMKGATQERPMFIAHETPAYAHTGVKDAVDADGKPVYQQMDASALIPVMWAEIQSLRQRLAAAGI
jgi:hypothetical protein